MWKKGGDSRKLFHLFPLRADIRGHCVFSRADIRLNLLLILSHSRGHSVILLDGADIRGHPRTSVRVSAVFLPFPFVQ